MRRIMYDRRIPAYRANRSPDAYAASLTSTLSTIHGSGSTTESTIRPSFTRAARGTRLPTTLASVSGCHPTLGCTASSVAAAAIGGMSTNHSAWGKGPNVTPWISPSGTWPGIFSNRATTSFKLGSDWRWHVARTKKSAKAKRMHLL